jgi:hypothetical protein
MHGASNQSTAWRFVEEQDEALALVQYYPGGAVDDHGNLVLSVWCSVGSPEFNRRFSDIDIPQAIRTGHPWVAARDFDVVCDGTETLLVDGKQVVFQWHSWWNRYALLVLLRRRPVLSVVRNLIKHD